MDHKDLNVWKQSVDFVVDIYGLTAFFPKEEVFGLTSQMRRASISIPSNIAEGAARISDAENIHFMYIALGSASELETQLIISNRLGFVSDISSQSQALAEIKQQILGLIRHLKSKKK
ncbi:MAG TPA: four helix bundle protein [Williamwhitmania sp.]|nr:four helix bundle protein [Williamwhitmania sp.]